MKLVPDSFGVDAGLLFHLMLQIILEKYCFQ